MAKRETPAEKLARLADFDDGFRAKHGSVLVGCDEAGRGAWAGPISAGAVVLPADRDTLQLLEGLDDSKKMTAASRDTLAERVKAVALAWHVEFISAPAIDKRGLTWANREAMRRCVAECKRKMGRIDVYLLDQSPAPSVRPLIMASKMDGKSLSVAAAAVLAKTHRDALMHELAAIYPEFSLGEHKGYVDFNQGTHLAEVNAHGRRQGLHRMTYCVKGMNEPARTASATAILDAEFGGDPAYQKALLEAKEDETREKEAASKQITLADLMAAMGN